MGESRKTERMRLPKDTTEVWLALQKASPSGTRHMDLLRTLWRPGWRSRRPGPFGAEGTGPSGSPLAGVIPVRYRLKMS